MTADEFHFLIVLYLIYLSDCFAAPLSTAWILYSRFRGTAWRLRTTNKAIVLCRRYWLLRPLLPPFGSSYALSPAQFAFGIQGVCSASPISEPAGIQVKATQFLEYDSVNRIEVNNNKLFINGDCWGSGTQTELTALKRSILEIVESSDRTHTIRRQFQNGYKAASSAQEQFNTIEKRTEILNTTCSLYATWLLIVAPILLFRFSMPWIIWGVLIPLGVLQSLCGILFLRAHRSLIPDAGYIRRETFFKMLLCPPMMLRACDYITKNIHIEGDVAAIIIACTSEQQWRPAIQQLWRSLMPIPRSQCEPQIARAMSEFAALYQAELKSFLLANNIDPLTLEIDPALIPAGQRSCPRCETLYNNASCVCHDCGEIELVPSSNG
jgi:hypothetical protein